MNRIVDFAGTSCFILVAATVADAQGQGVGVRKVAQLIGDSDYTLKVDTLTQTHFNAHIGGTDLGSSFEHKGKLYFLFGDTFSDTFTTQNDRDSFVYTTSTNPWNVTFSFPFVNGNKYRPITIVPTPIQGHGPLCVPSGGVSYQDVMYMVYTNQWFGPPQTGNMERSYMCKSVDDGFSWSNLYTLSVVGSNHNMSNTHFINISMSVLSAASRTEDSAVAYNSVPKPYEDNLLIFGSGAYRKSALYLATVPATKIGTKTELRYFAGLNGSTPQWSTAESAAVSLKTVGGTDIATNIGEFSAQYIPQLGKWVVLCGYNQVRISMADQPWGPYSVPVTLWDAWANDGYGNFMHVPSGWNPPSDDFGGTPHDADPNNPDRPGGGYGAYLIPRFTTGTAANCQLYFTHSTWNPYRIVLMRAQWPIPIDPPVAGSPMVLSPGDSTWFKTPGIWFEPFQHQNTFTLATESWISTHDDLSDNLPGDDVGLMWRWLPRDSKNKNLTFFFHGGDQEVLLLEGVQTIPPTTTSNISTIYNNIKAGAYGRKVECAFGAEDNNPDRRAEWDLRPLDRSNLKVVVVDHESAVDWDFISVGPMTLERFQ